MLSFVLRRLLGLAVTLAAASAIVFLAMEVLPGDPAEVMLGTNARPDTLAALRAQARPRSGRPPNDMSPGQPACCRAISGRSYTYSTPVTELVAERLAGLPAARVDCAGAHHADRHSRWARSRRRGATARPTSASWARRRSASRAELLVRDAAGAAVRDDAALVPGRRLSRLVGGAVAGAARR